MGTVVAIETSDGVAIAGDRRVTRGGTVVSESSGRVVDLDDAGAGAVGDQGDVDEFRRRLEAERQERELETDGETDVQVLARIAARVAEQTGVEAVVAARDEDGAARLRQVGADGRVLSDPVAAIGSGATIALGRLESADRDRELNATETFVRDVVESVAERDPDTGEEAEVWSLASESAGE